MSDKSRTAYQLESLIIRPSDALRNGVNILENIMQQSPNPFKDLGLYVETRSKNENPIQVADIRITGGNFFKLLSSSASGSHPQDTVAGEQQNNVHRLPFKSLDIRGSDLPHRDSGTLDTIFAKLRKMPLIEIYHD
ncbi:MAG: hypothetical protein J3Q66DRAFT_406469 [Benniella sp.]|nr:MAG: hypothetical protein J3Q66DRAFT_406469 [Benniella sp.]